MSTLRYRGVELVRDGLGQNGSATQTKHNGRRPGQKAAHTSQLVYRGIPYSHGVSHQAMSENWL